MDRRRMTTFSGELYLARLCDDVPHPNARSGADTGRRLETQASALRLDDRVCPRYAWVSVVSFSKTLVQLRQQRRW